MKHSLYFDTSVDPIQKVLEAVHNIYGASETVPVKGVIGEIRQTIEVKPKLPELQPITQADVSSAETVLTSTGEVSPTTFEVDATGMPFDARIHQNGKTGKGVWKRKKNVDASLREAVEAELRSGLANMPVPDNRVELPAGGVEATIITDNAPELPVLPGPLDPMPSPLTIDEQASVVQQHQESVQAIAQASAEQAAATALANAMAAAAANAPAPTGRFAAILASAGNAEVGEVAHMLSNEVSACIASQQLTLDDLAKVASDLTGTEGTAAGFFTLINNRGFWPNIAKNLDAIVTSKG